eukprot:gene22981-biopygen5791
MPKFLPNRGVTAITQHLLGEQEGGAGVARAWRGRGAGCRHIIGLGWRGRGAGMARTWRGHFLFPLGPAWTPTNPRAAGTLPRRRDRGCHPPPLGAAVKVPSTGPSHWTVGMQRFYRHMSPNHRLGSWHRKTVGAQGDTHFDSSLPAVTVTSASPICQRRGGKEQRDPHHGAPTHGAPPPWWETPTRWGHPPWWGPPPWWGGWHGGHHGGTGTSVESSGIRPFQRRADVMMCWTTHGPQMGGGRPPLAKPDSGAGGGGWWGARATAKAPPLSTAPGACPSLFWPLLLPFFGERRRPFWRSGRGAAEASALPGSTERRDDLDDGQMIPVCAGCRGPPPPASQGRLQAPFRYSIRGALN